MSKFVIEGGQPLIGKIRLSGAKNAGFKEIVAGLFTDQPLTLSNVSLVRDVYVVRDIINDLGGVVKISHNHKVQVTGSGLKTFEIAQKFGEVSRVCSIMIGPLLFRFGKALFPAPGGDKIGKRPLDRHLAGLKKMGAKIEEKGQYYLVTARKLKGAPYRFAKSTHTGTETLILCAVFAQGTTVLENAAVEPEVLDLIKMFQNIG